MGATNPYNYNMPVRPDMFFGRREDVQALTRNLAATPGDSYALVGGRRMGKTSLLEALLRASAEEPARSMLLLPVHLDLTGQGVDSVSTFFHTLGERAQALLDEQLAPSPVDRRVETGQPPAPAFARLLEGWGRAAMARVGCRLRLVLLLDECEHIVEQPWTPEMYGALRYLLVGQATRSLLKVVMAGSHRFLTQVRERGSPLRNVLQYHRLCVLDTPAARDLVTRPTGGALPEEVVQAVVVQSGGHPFLIQYLMYHLWDCGLKNATLEMVHRVATGFCHERSDFDDWMDGLGTAGMQVYQALAQAEETLTEARLRAVLRPTLPDLPQVLDALCYHGLAVRETAGEGYRAVGDMFQEWFMAYRVPSGPSTSLAPPIPPPDKTAPPLTAEQQPSIGYRAPWHEEVRQVGLDDLVRNVNTWNRERDLGLTFYRQQSGGAAWAVGNVLIEARAVTATTTEIWVNDYQWRDPDGTARRAWQELRKLFTERGIRAAGGPVNTDSIAQKTLSRIRIAEALAATQSTTAEDRAEWEADLRAREPGISQAELDQVWGQLCKLAERGKAIAHECEARASKTPDEAAAEFFARLEAIEVESGKTEAAHGEAQVVHVETEGGMVVLGDVRVEGGDLIGRDKVAGVDQRGQTVQGPQTNVAGDEHGPVLSGTFHGSVAAGSRPPAADPLDLEPSPEATRLHRILKTRLDLEEFRTLCFHLGLNYDDLGGEGLGGKARQLVLRLQKRDALPLLIEWLRRERPDITV